MKFPKGTTEHSINKNGKCEYLVSIWDFGAIHPQSERQHYICNDHPAKMRPALTKAILEVYGESPVLDPMAGVGTTLIEAMLLGMSAVGVEYEKKFVDQANKNISHIAKLFTNKNLGKAICIKGDARNLSCLNNQRVNSVIFSPPYFNALKKGDEGPYARSKRISYRERIKRFQGYSTDSSNIGNIAHFGNIRKFGSIVFSPPYAGALSLSGGRQYRMKKGSSGDPTDKHNKPYSFDQRNIGNIPSYRNTDQSLFGSILFSPPYEGALNASKHVGGIASRDPQLAKTGQYSKDKSNIGNTLGQTYLSEMYKVYRECYRVLKPDKFMVVVVKDIQRNWKTVPLGADTIKLCQAAGFDCHDVIINKMYFPSFWMLNLARKAQNEGMRDSLKFHPLKTHEYVLVFRKPTSSEF